MADPLSVIASLTGVIGFGLQTAQTLVTFSLSVADARVRIERVADEVRRTSGYLETLKALVEDNRTRLNPRALNDFSEVCVSCQGIFTSIEKRVGDAGSKEEEDGMSPKAQGKQKVSALGRARWAMLEPHVEKELADLSRVKTDLQLVLEMHRLLLSPPGPTR